MCFHFQKTVQNAVGIPRFSDAKKTVLILQIRGNYFSLKKLAGLKAKACPALNSLTDLCTKPVH